MTEQEILELASDEAFRFLKMPDISNHEKLMYAFMAGMKQDAYDVSSHVQAVNATWKMKGIL